jgi:hypothetical protein
MGISHKHAYRFVYLKSEEWKDVRFEALAREMARCQICGEENFSNDAHHIYYPKSVWDTKADYLVILCRECHEFAQLLFNQQKNREAGKQAFDKIVAIIHSWFKAKRYFEISPTRSKTSSLERDKQLLTSLCCQACKIPNPITVVDIFKELPHALSGFEFKMSLCDSCLSDLKLNVKIRNPELDNNEPRAKGWAYRAIRKWKEAREATQY